MTARHLPFFICHTIANHSEIDCKVMMTKSSITQHYFQQCTVYVTAKSLHLTVVAKATNNRSLDTYVRISNYQCSTAIVDKPIGHQFTEGTQNRHRPAHAHVVVAFMMNVRTYLSQLQ